MEGTADAPAHAMFDIVSAIEIDAPAETVWQVLVDLARYHAWNPFIREAEGDVRIGGRVRVHVRLPDLPRFSRVEFEATITASTHARELRWLGYAWKPWLGSGDHLFSLEPLGDERTRFTQRERFDGALPRLFHGLVARETARGFDAMNRALARRAEDAFLASRRTHYAAE